MKHHFLIILLIICLFLQGFLQRLNIFPLWSKNYSSKQVNMAEGLSPDHLLLALSGFRELVASILWVKADSFFHDGNFDAVLPIIRLVTWLDPHNVDYYSVGMWHISYNFTDSEHRSDRRYIPAGLALGKEGVKHNPHSADMLFDLGWTWYHKIDDDYHQAVTWMSKANEKSELTLGRKSMLGHALLRNGQPHKALEHFEKLLQIAKKKYEEDPGYGNKQMLQTIKDNRNHLLLRITQRNPNKYKTQAPFEMNFKAQVQVIEPKVILIQGNWDLCDQNSRMRVILRDDHGLNSQYAKMNWDSNNNIQFELPEDQTFMQDQLFVKHGKFFQKIDMSRDITIYPFESKRYILEFYFNPRSATNPIQDLLGWNGEGMTDKNFLNTNARPKQRVLYATLNLTRDQILREGIWKNKMPLVKTVNFKLTQ